MGKLKHIYEKDIFNLVETLHYYHKIGDKSNYKWTLAKLSLTLGEYSDIFKEEHPIDIMDYYAKLWEF